jgi:hypothetical protein
MGFQLAIKMTIDILLKTQPQAGNHALSSSGHLTIIRRRTCPSGGVA